jgi:carboxypeptidase Taq
MPNDAKRLYHDVCQYARRTAVMASVDAVLGWDERTQMPSAGAEHRAEQSTVLAGLIHQRWIDPKFGEQIDELSQTPMAADPQSDAGVLVRRLKRQRDKKVKLPQSLVEELARTAVLGQQAWEEARQNNDFPSFRPLLEKTIDLKRQQAEALGYDECAYDALLDEYEPEERTANVGRVLDGLREELVPLVAAIQQSPRRPHAALLHRSFPVMVQERFGREAATAIGFDFSRGRLDVTTHPFCTTLGPHDCRITTRYDGQFFSSAFFGILHESGHAIYEQGLPVEHYGLPLGEAISLGIHESQSRLWENMVGRSRAFWTCFYPLARERFPIALEDVTPDEFYFAVNDVGPSLIRVEADEATYNLHILVRFELERALLQGDLQVAELPGAWNEKYRQYLGITPPDDRTGVLQDVHWSAGLVGYFPTYSLGNLYAAQFFAKAAADLEDLEGAIAHGHFEPLLAWLRENIHCHGQRWSAAELVQRVTGQPLSAKPLVEHLRAKLGRLYGL